MTSDGLPQEEMNAMCRVGRHRNFIVTIAALANSPLKKDGLLMSLVKDSYTILGDPPSFETITRDTFKKEESR